MARLRSVGRWLLRHWIVTLLVVLVLIPMLRPAIYEVTHFNALDCGSLLPYGSYNLANETVGRQEITCFVQAHQQCKAATLFEISQGVEGAGELTFRTANGLAGCTLSVIGYEKGFCTIPLYCTLVPYIDSGCRTMQQDQDGLHFLNCGNVKDIPFLI
jgi:hypothetical protein